MKLRQHPSIQREAPEQELSGASFFRTCNINLCLRGRVWAPSRAAQHNTPSSPVPQFIPPRPLFFVFPVPPRRAAPCRGAARVFYCGVDVQEGFSAASNRAAALKKPPCPKLCFRAAVFCVFRAAAISVPIRRRRSPPSTPPLYCITTTGSLRCSAKAEVLWRPRAVFVGAFIGAPEAAVFVPLRRWSSRSAFFATFSRRSDAGPVQLRRRLGKESVKSSPTCVNDRALKRTERANKYP